MSTTLQVLENPLKCDRIEIEMPVGLTVAEMLIESGREWMLDEKCPVYITLESEWDTVELTQSDCYTTYPAEGETIGIKAIPSGGGGGKKSPIVGIVIAVVALVIAYFVPPLAPLMKSIAFSALAGSAASMLSGGGPNIPSLSGVSDNEQTSAIYSINGTQNRVNKYGPIPVMMGGTMRIFPPLAAEPYTEVSGEDQYLRQRFAIIGPVKLSDFKIGETDITDYDGVEIEYVEGWPTDTLPTLYADGRDIKEESVQATLRQVDSWATRTTQPLTKEVSFDMNIAQLFRIEGSEYLPTSVTFDVAYREDGTSGPWLAPVIDGGAVQSTTLNGVYATDFDSSTVFRSQLGSGSFSTFHVDEDNTYRWRGIATNKVNGDIFVASSTGQILKDAGGTGVFVVHADTGYDWDSVAVNSVTGDVWATVRNGDIYIDTGGTGTFTSKSAGSRFWQGIDLNETTGDVWAADYVGKKIYKSAGGSGPFLDVGAPVLPWMGIAVNQSNGDVWATVYDDTEGGIYKNTGGVGSFNPTGAEPRLWSDVAINDTNGDAWATVDAPGDIYKSSGGSGFFVPVNSGQKYWYGISFNEISEVSDSHTRVVVSGYYTNSRLFNYKFNVTEGQYDVRWRRVTEDHQEDTEIYDDIAVYVLRSISEHPGIDTQNLPPLAVIDLRIKASGQLNGVVNQFNCLAESYLPVWTGSEIEYQLSDNPAWAFVNILYGSANKRNVTTLSRFDFDNLSDWATLCESKSWKVNGILDASTTVAKALGSVSTIGRASPTLIDNKYGVAVDWEKDTVTQVFTPRNSWGFESSKVWPEDAHAIRAKFTDESSGYELSEGIIYFDGYDESTATLFWEDELQYATSWDQVWEYFRFRIADRSLRPEIYTFNVDVENLRCVRGDRVRLVHDVMLVGLGQARIKSVTTDGSGNVTDATIDSTWTLDDTTSYAINIQRFNGQVYEGFIDNPPSTQDVQAVTFNPAIPAAVAPTGGELIAFGEADTGVGLDLIVQGIQPGANLTARLVCQDYAPGIQTAADGTIDPYDPQIVYGRSSQLGRPGTPTIVDVVSDESAIIVANDGTLVTRAIITFSNPNSAIPVSSFTCQYRRTGSELWDSAGSVSGDSTFIAVDNLTDSIDYDFRVQSLTPVGVTSQWAYVLGHTVVGKTSNPPDVTGFSAQQNGAVVTYKWNQVSIVDLQGYEIRYAPQGEFVWEGATLVTSVTRGTLITNTVLPPGSWTVGIRAVDRTRLYSTNSTTQDIDVVNALTEIDSVVDECPRWSGVSNNLLYHTISGCLVPLSGNLASDDGFGTFDQFVPNSLEATHEIDKLSLALTSYVRVFGEARSTDPPIGSFSPPDYQISHSTDDVLYSAWTNWSSGFIETRYVKGRAKMEALSPSILTLVSTSSDIQERAETGTTTVGIGGTTITFDQQFLSSPSVQLTPQGSSGLYATYDNLSTTSVDVTIYNSSGVDVGGTLSYRIEGV